MALLDQLVRTAPAHDALCRIARGAVASHAYLVDSDDAGVARHFAMHLGRSLACLAKDDRPCGRCASCVRAGPPYLSEVTPMGVEFRIRQIHDLLEECTLSLEPGAHRVYAFTGAEAMNEESANAFLKLLEEPPAAVQFVLSTAAPGRILATIRSRCHPVHVDFPPPAALAAGPLAGGPLDPAWSWAILETWGRSPALLAQPAGETSLGSPLESRAPASRERVDSLRNELRAEQLANPTQGLFVDLPHALASTAWFLDLLGQLLTRPELATAMTVSAQLVDWSAAVAETAGDALHEMEAAIRKTAGTAYVHPLLEEESYERSFKRGVVFLSLDAFFRAALLTARAARPDRPPPEGPLMARLSAEVPAMARAARLGHAWASELVLAVESVRAQIHANVGVKFALESFLLSQTRGR